MEKHLFEKEFDFNDPKIRVGFARLQIVVMQMEIKKLTAQALKLVDEIESLKEKDMPFTVKALLGLLITQKIQQCQSAIDEFTKTIEEDEKDEEHED